MRRALGMTSAGVALTIVVFFAALAPSIARPTGSGRALSDALTVSDTGAVTFSGVVAPHGRATTAFFQFGLAQRYREPRPSHPVYDMSTTAVHLAPAFHVYSVAGRAKGLVPNALYNLRLVARSSAGTVYSPNASFRTARDAAPPPPVIGAKVNVAPGSGLVLLRRPNAGTSPAFAGHLIEGTGFRPLTEARQLPAGSQIDARAGTLRLEVAGRQRGATQRIALHGGLFAVAQSSQGPTRGVTTLNLLAGDFPGAPAYGSCVANPAAPLQTVRATDRGGRFMTFDRDSSATANTAGTAWDTTARCDGTLTVVHRGSVVVSDFPQLRTVTVHAGQRYLATATGG